MTKEKLLEVLKESYTTGEGDTFVEDALLESASLFIENEVKDELSEVEQNLIIEAYRDGFLGRENATIKSANAWKK